MRRVLVTHVDGPLGGRLTKTLCRDPDVALVFGLGAGPMPAVLEAHRDRCAYQRIDLARARHLAHFFASERFERARIDSVIHLPFPGEPEGGHIPGGVATLVSETRRLLQACRRAKAVERFVYLSSAYVYRPEPGNANVFPEDRLLDFEPETDPRVRAWVDADLVCQGEMRDAGLRVTILRAPTIVSDAGELLESPALTDGWDLPGFDPLVSVIAERDVARAALLALHADRPGVYNITGREAFPRSALRPPQGGGWRSLPGVLRGAVALAERALRPARRPDPRGRYGILLDTRAAADALGFAPEHRIALRREGGALRLDTTRCH